MFKYIWIFMLAIAEVLGWIYVIRDLIETAKTFRNPLEFSEFELFTQIWIIVHFAVLFISSLIGFFN